MNQEVLKSKQEAVATLKQETQNSATVIIAEYRGLSVAQLQTLRRELRKFDAVLGVHKNTFVERALTELGYEDAKQYLEGPNAIIFSKTTCEGPKALVKFAKRNQALKIKAGIVEGKVIDAAGVKEIAALPGRDGLISMFLGCLNAPVSKLAATLKAVAEAKA